MQQQNNSIIVAEAFKTYYNERANGNAKAPITLFVGDLSSYISSPELQIQWGLLPGYNLIITMERANKFKASLISPQFQTVDQFVLKTQLEVMLEKVINPDRGTQEAIQPVIEMLVEMGFNEEVARIATIEADNDIEKAVVYAIPLSAKIRAENVLAYHANAGNLEKGLQAYYKARLEHLALFCLLCDRVVENHDGGKSCVCSRNLCEWQFKQIGLVPTSSIVKPRLVQGLPPAFNIVSLSAGEDHSVACFENGDVYLWGKGDRGQLGDGTFRSFASAVHLPLQKFSKVVAGNGFTLGLSVDGDLWVWGTGKAELGLGQLEEMVVPRPTRIDAFWAKNERVYFKDISVADRLCFAIASNNMVYAWGEQYGVSRNVPSPIPGLYARSVTAHYLHPVCVDDQGNIRIWANWNEMFVRTTLAASLNAYSQPRRYSAAFSYGDTLFGVYDSNTSIHEYTLTRKEDRYVLRHKKEHLGATQYAVGSGFAVLAQYGTVRVLGVGSGVMGYEETTANPSGVEMSQIRNARHLAAGPHHVVCVAMNDRIVYGQSEEEAARDVFVYQWGRDHSALADVQCQGDIQRMNDQIRWAKLAVEDATAYVEKKMDQWKQESNQQANANIVNEIEAAVNYVKENYASEELDMPQEGPFESGEDLEKWNEQFLHGQQVQQVQQDKDKQDEPAVENNDNSVKEEAELSEQEKASNMYIWCYHMCERLNMTIDADKAQLIIELNHPLMLLSKIANGESSRFKDIPIDTNTKDNDGNTALMLAMQDNDYTLFTQVLDLGPDVDVVNNKHEYPLDVAVSCGGSYSKAFVVALVEKGATKFSPTSQAAIVSVISSAAEFVPKLKAKLGLFLDE